MAPDPEKFISRSARRQAEETGNRYTSNDWRFPSRYELEGPRLSRDQERHPACGEAVHRGAARPWVTCRPPKRPGVFSVNRSRTVRGRKQSCHPVTDDQLGEPRDTENRVPRPSTPTLGGVFGSITRPFFSTACLGVREPSSREVLQRKAFVMNAVAKLAGCLWIFLCTMGQFLWTACGPIDRIACPASCRAVDDFSSTAVDGCRDFGGHGLTMRDGLPRPMLRGTPDVQPVHARRRAARVDWGRGEHDSHSQACGMPRQALVRQG